MFRRRSLRALLALSALTAASLACATLGGPGPNDFPPRPTETLVAEDEYKPTDAPEGVEATEPSADAPTESAETTPTEATGGDTNGFNACANGPADVPIMDVSTTFTYCDTTMVSFQTSEATYDDVLKYYKDELSAAGWTIDDKSGIAVETADAAVLYYVKDDRHIIVTVSYSSSDKLTSLQIVTSP